MMKAKLYFQLLDPSVGDPVGVSGKFTVLAKLAISGCKYVIVALSNNHIGIAGPCEAAKFDFENPSKSLRYVELKNPPQIDKDYKVSIHKFGKFITYVGKMQISFRMLKAIWKDRLWYAMDNDGASYIVCIP